MYIFVLRHSIRIFAPRSKRWGLSKQVTYPCPAKKPRLAGLTLSLNTTISMLSHLWSDETSVGVHSCTIHHWSASRCVVRLTFCSLIARGLKKAKSSGRSVWPMGEHKWICCCQTVRSTRGAICLLFWLSLAVRKYCTVVEWLVHLRNFYSAHDQPIASQTKVC